ICEAARRCGSERNLTLFACLKEPLIRKYGRQWYEKVCRERAI
ncbi:MAG: DUF3109 family protein, partial [Bacteroidales bacterium]|nr:DUF3109 family protein [Bacteroidales bacterium]